MPPTFLPVAIPDTSFLCTTPPSNTLAFPRRMPRPKKINTTRVHNRILALMAHTTRYVFKGETRLAADAGVSKSAVCRLLNGRSSPSYALVLAITRALEKQLQRSLDPRDLISTDGTYPTPSACALAGCNGCLPSEAYDEQDQLKPEYRHLRPGQWSVATPITSSDQRMNLIEGRQDG
ncbi:MAG: hypothetical protein JWN98_2447 [Abditibacteriota bacterium]|nr:hypothetical protein [Abditibacteriota bacterium]